MAEKPKMAEKSKMNEKSKMTENTEVGKTPKVDDKPKIVENGYRGTAQKSARILCSDRAICEVIVVLLLKDTSYRVTENKRLLFTGSVPLKW